MKIKNLPIDERPIEKGIRYGVSSLENVQLIAILMGSGIKGKSVLELSQDILNLSSDGISGLLRLDMEDILKIKGMGRFRTVRLLATIELCKRINTARRREGYIIDSSSKAADFFMEELRSESKEHFCAVVLSSKGKVLGAERISTGEVNATMVHPREAFSLAIKKSATGVIFFHNHPSGDPSPSEHDKNTTDRLVKCGRLLGIEVVDHIIIGDGNFFSFKERNLF